MKPFKSNALKLLLALRLGAAFFALVHRGYQVWHDFHIDFYLQQLESTATEVISKFYE